MNKILIVFLILITNQVFGRVLTLSKDIFPAVPFRQFTQGSLCDEKDPDMDEHRYQERIPYCKRVVSNSMKSKIYKLYHVPDKCKQYYTIDHYYPLSLGGSNHIDNLWPEHKNVKKSRQDLEYELFIALSEGRITQEEALLQIDWEKMNPALNEAIDPCSMRVLHANN